MPVETQAKTMWCPHTAGRQADSSCIGSKCMAWRWMPDYRADQPSSIDQTFALYRSWPQLMERTSERWVCEYCKNEPDAVQQCPECEGKGTGHVHAPVGFCGLAGIPLLLP